MASRVHMDMDMGRLRTNIDTLDGKLDLAIDLTVGYHSTEGEGHMRATAPWTDRTGAARSGLHTATLKGSGKHTIVFAHSVPYGIWLEVKNSGRYEVIMPSVRIVGAHLMESLSHLMGRLR